MSAAPPPLPTPGWSRAWVLRILGQVLLLLCASVLLCLSIASFWESLGWQVRLLSPFRPQYLLLGLLLLLATTWLRYAWLTRAVCVLSVVVNGWVLWPWLTPIGDPPPAESFVLMSWNTWTYHPDPERVIRGVESSGADVVLLCETPLPWRDQPPAAMEGYEVFSENQFTVAVRKGGPVRLHAATLGRAPLRLEALLEFEGRSFLALSVHHARPTTKLGCRIQDYWYIMMKRWADENKHPYLMAGDFNATPWCRPLRKTTRALQLRDASKGHGVDSTYPTSPPLVSRVVGVPIDQVFYSAELATGRRWIGAPGGSNHRPVFVDVGWR